MPDKIIKDQVQLFYNRWQGMNMVYEDYARTVDIPYTTLQILNFIVTETDCTQKTICSRTFLPKQTVNSVITSFYKKGLVVLKELPADRRTKTIHLTEAGQQFADRVIPKIRKAEYEAMERLTPEQRENLLEGMRIYCEVFRAAMLSDKDAT